MLLQRLFFLGLVVFPLALMAQPDSTFIELLSNDARLNTGLRYRDRSFRVATPAGEEFKLESEGLAFRIGGRYKFLSYTFSLPISDLGTGTDGQESKNLGLGLTLFMRQQLLSAGFRDTKGFRVVTPTGDDVFRDDVDLFTANIYGFRVLKNKQFSLRAAYRQRDRQLKSSGSFLLGGLLGRRLLTADEGIAIPFNTDRTGKVTRMAQTKVGAGIGYAHTFILGNNFFLSPLFIVGPEFRFIAYDWLGKVSREQEDLRISGRIRGYLALGWNGKRTAVALTGTYLPSLDVSENFRTRFDEMTIQLRITRRFLFSD
jgi:hypothetical protein